jgi:hypothetical protein
MKKNLLIVFLVLATVVAVKAQYSGPGIPVHRNVNACFTSDEIEIDGVADEDAWEEVESIPLENFWLNDEWTEEMPDSENFYVVYKALWDSTSIYLYVDVTDDKIVKASDHPDWNIWEADDVEFFLYWRYGSETGDTSVNGNPSWGTETWYQILLNPMNNMNEYPPMINNQVDGILPENDPRIKEVEYAFSPKPGGGGYTCELKVNFAIWKDNEMAPGVPVPYKEVIDSIGFELTVADNDDDATAQQNRILAFSCDSSSGKGLAPWYPNIMGKMTFVHCEATGIFQDFRSIPDMNVYPNPVHDVMVIENADPVESVSISNLVGQKVKSLTGLYQKRNEINMSGLPEGIYLITVRDISGHTHTTKVIKK